MAVLAGIYGDQVPIYAGCVLDTYEHNGYDDSDWYAVCWDEEKGRIVEVEYDTTRAGRGGWARIDATDKVLRKVYRYYHRICKDVFDRIFNPRQAKAVRKGDTVAVVRGRKVPRGATGVCFWVGEVLNIYTHQKELRVGVEIAGNRVFLPEEYVEVVGWQDRLIRGDERKRRIRNEALQKMPPWSRDRLG